MLDAEIKQRSPHNIQYKERRRNKRYILYSLFNLGARKGWVVNATPLPLYPRERAPLPTVEEVVWAPDLVRMDMEKRNPLAPTEVRSSQPVASRYTDSSIPADLQVHNGCLLLGSRETHLVCKQNATCVCVCMCVCVCVRERQSLCV